MTGQMGPVLLELNKQIRESRETRRKVTGSLMYPLILIFVAVTAVTVDALDGRAHFRRYVQGHGGRAARDHPVRRRPVQRDRDLRPLRRGDPCGPGGRLPEVLRHREGQEICRRGPAGDPDGRVSDGPDGDVPVRLEHRPAPEVGRPDDRDLDDPLLRLPELPDLPGGLAPGPGAGSPPGRPLAASLEETGLFSSMLTNMVRTGEESGQLSAVMEQIAPYYKEKMEGLVAKVTKLLEPIIIMGMGSTIAGLMLAIYMPMFEMAGKVK